MQSKGKIFKIVIISMMIFVILSTGLSFILYLGGDKENTENIDNVDNVEILENESLTGEVLSGSDAIEILEPITD